MASVVNNNKDSLITFYIASESEDSDNYRRLVDFYKDNENVKIRYLNPFRAAMSAHFSG